MMVLAGACRFNPKLTKERSMTESAAGPTGPGTVILDLGADVGALILYTPAGLDGEEIEISRDGTGLQGSGRTHSRVRPRHLPGQTRYAAVYPGLPAAEYTVWLDEHIPAGTVTVHEGEAARFRWPRVP
jgi:hypothetical protein